MRKLSPSQKQSLREILDGLVAESKERALRRTAFLEGLREFLHGLDGQQKLWLFKMLENELRGCGSRA